MKLGIFTVSMPDYEPSEAFQKVAAIGYEGLEWRVVEDKGDRAKPTFWSGNRATFTAEQLIEAAPELKKQAAAAGVAMPSIAPYIDSSDPAAIRLNMKAAQAVGARMLRIGPGKYDPAVGGYPALLKQARERYAAVARLAAEHGVRAVIETHMGQLAPSIAKAMAILDGLDPKHVGIMWDPGNGVYEGQEQYRMAIEIAGPYLAEVHVKNAQYIVDKESEDQKTWKATWAPVHQGVVDWKKVVAELKRAGYDGWLMLEDFSTVMPLEERLRFNHDWFRRLI